MQKIFTSVYFNQSNQLGCRQLFFRIFYNLHKDVDILVKFADDLTFGEKFANIQYLYTAYNLAGKDNMLYSLNVYTYGISDVHKILEDNKSSHYIVHQDNFEVKELATIANMNSLDIEKLVDGKTNPPMPDIPLNVDHYNQYHEGMYNKCGVGGTFNLLHNGHKLLLSLAALLSNNHLYVGITSNELLQKKSYFELIESLETRIWLINQFLQRFNRSLTITYIDLRHPLETWDFDYEALIVSEETYKAVDIFNNKRKEIGLAMLDAAVLKLVESKSDDIKFSSTQLREIIAKNLVKSDEILELKQNFLTAVAVLKNLKYNTMGKSLAIPASECRTKELIADFDLKLITALHIDEYVFYQLCCRYSGSDRYYHTLSHILDCVRKLIKHYKGQLSEEEFNISMISVFFHDIIYDVKAKDNEERSAVYFSNMASLMGLSQGYIDIISSVIKHTEHHTIPEKTDHKAAFIAMMDVDLSILSAPTDVYIEYAKNIRKEYKHIPWDIYKKERAKVLKTLCGKLQNCAFPLYNEESLKRNIDYEIDNILQGDIIEN